MLPHTTTLGRTLTLTLLCTALALAGCGGGGGGGSSSQSTSSSSSSGSATTSKAASISFSSATPDVLVYQGGEGETQAEVKFLVKDALNQPLAGETVSFSLSTSVGGIKLQSVQAITDSTGVATARVTSGSVPTPVRVTAQVGQYSAQSSVLSISTGLAHQNGFSLSADNYMPPFYDTNGESISLTASASDRLGAPVPDGTVINFVAEGGVGILTPQCRTSKGSCSVTLSSNGDRDALVDKGRQTILAYTLGEESFDDANSNGLYDSGETILTDLGEAFINAKTGVNHTKATTWASVSTLPYTEFFIDLNGNGLHDELGDGQFTGVARASGSKSTLHVRRSVEIIWARTLPASITPTSENATVVNYKGTPYTWLSNVSLCSGTPAATTSTVTYTAIDDSGNPLPGGTTISMSVSNMGAATTSARISSNITSLTTKKSNGTDPETLSVDLALPSGVLCSSTAGAPDRLLLTISVPGKTPVNASYAIF